MRSFHSALAPKALLELEKHIDLLNWLSQTWYVALAVIAWSQSFAQGVLSH